MNDKIITALSPRLKTGEIDKRFNPSIERILKSIGDEAVERLADFYQHTSELQRKASQDGFELAIAFYKEAEYLEKNCRFDEDNPYSFKSKSLRKQILESLQVLGFKKKNADKLVTAAQFLLETTGDIYAWLKALTPSHVYVISNMSEAGINQVISEVKYPEFHLSAGAQDISVRRLEEIRRMYPKHLKVLPHDPDPIREELVVIKELDFADQLVELIQGRDLDEIYGDDEQRNKLSVIKDELMTIAHIAIPNPTKPTYV